MQIGCGVYEHAVRGRVYLYFWHYENEGGRRKQISEYVGVAGRPRSREEAARRCEAYYDRMAGELARIRSGTVMTLRGSR
jgi:hypothetical protein